jgi:hypothetical protein
MGGPALFRQRDVTAAIKAAERAGKTVSRVLIGVDGSIILEFATPITPVEGQPEEKNEWDVVLPRESDDARVAEMPALTGPGYWMHETSGVLRPAVEAYLNGVEMTPEQIAAMRAYLRQWIMAPVWDANPYAGKHEVGWLAQMRFRIDRLTTREAIKSWVEDAIDAGMDPL